MIEDLIETGQYKEALQYLNDMDNEQVRYQRLVCLYGLKELQQAKREGMKAKVLAGETYYDVVAIYVSILKDLEEFEEAINIIVEELSMPYIPYQYETVFNAAYDELLLAKQEASFDGVTQKVFNEEDIENILTKKDTNEDLLYSIKYQDTLLPVIQENNGVQTGYDDNMALYLTIGGLSFAGIAAILISLNKKKRRK